MEELLIKKNELGGIYTALVSPIKDETLDVAYQDKIIEYQIENGVSGIVIFGTTGQNPCFTWEEQVKRTIEIANKFKDKTRIIFCFSSNCTREVIKKMEEIEKCLGPVTFLSTTGYYNKPGQKGQVKHFEKIANSIKGNLIIYEVPGRTNVSMNEESWRELSKIENIIGIKDATNLAVEKKKE